jgi:hypothetical protein
MPVLAEVALWALGVAVIIGIFASLLRRIGYPGQYAGFFIMPGLNLVALLLLATKQWPVERELARLRLLAGESIDPENDIESVMSHAIACEQKHRRDQAISLYNLAAERSGNPQVKQYAMECAQRLIDHRQT